MNSEFTSLEFPICGAPTVGCTYGSPQVFQGYTRITVIKAAVNPQCTKIENSKEVNSGCTEVEYSKEVDSSSQSPKTWSSPWNSELTMELQVCTPDPSQCTPDPSQCTPDPSCERFLSSSDQLVIPPPPLAWPPPIWWRDPAVGVVCMGQKVGVEMCILFSTRE